MQQNNVLPTLYKVTATGSIQEWTVRVVLDNNQATIVTKYGKVGGEIITAEEVVREGKNTGKKNETTPLQQAEKEAKARWKKKQDREGYTTSKDGVVQQDCISPMLAHPLKNVLAHTHYPCDAQRKFNGTRLIVQVVNGQVTLWSRKQAKVTSLPHIQAAYEKAFQGVLGTFIFDGECYRHGWPLQKISGYFRTQEPKEGYLELKHCVYDMPSSDGPWSHREGRLVDIYSLYLHTSPCIELVEAVRVASEKEAWQLHDTWVQEGYEGAILRQLNYPYEFGKRSQGLAKLKKFQDAEFIIQSCKEGKGKFEGTAIFTCLTPEGKPFDCCAPGDLDQRAWFWHNRDKFIGKPLTVRYFELSQDGIPIFPVGIAIRDYE